MWVYRCHGCGLLTANGQLDCCSHCGADSWLTLHAEWDAELIHALLTWEGVHFCAE